MQDIRPLRRRRKVIRLDYGAKRTTGLAGGSDFNLF